MTRMPMDIPSQRELAALETDTRFFMRLLIGAGIAAAAIVGAGVVWHENDPAAGGLVFEQLQAQPTD